jgi:cell division control protein 45
MLTIRYPQKESQQRYKEMSISFKKSLYEKIKNIAPKYNLSDLIFSSFYRHYGYKATLSASDVVFALSALLDAGGEWIAKHGSKHEKVDVVPGIDVSLGKSLAGVGAGIRTGFAAVNGRLMDSISKSLEETRSKEEWKVNFYVAYDALDK